MMAKINQGNFRNYDVRGIYPDEIDATTAYVLGRAFAVYTGAQRVVIGRDARESSPILCDHLARGLSDQGVSVVDIGMVTTDVLYFAVWKYGFDGGIVVTASHSTKENNGFKLMRKSAVPIGKGSGMDELYVIAATGIFPEAQKGTITTQDVFADYTYFVRNFIDVRRLTPLTVVMDAGNGLGGIVAQHVFRDLPITIIPLFFEPDGTFPNHGPNPLLPENRQAIIEKVRAMNADCGIAWDGDADRVFFIDESGEYVHADFITLLLGLSFLERFPGAGIVYDVRASNAVKDCITATGGKAYRERVGHSFIKERMRKEDALFGGEVSGHYYFKSNSYADNGMIPALMLLELLSKKKKKLSELVAQFSQYHVSGEINSTVADVQSTIQKIVAQYHDAVSVDYLDGVTITYADWHFNLRPSANDPVIRLNVEAKTAAMVQEKTAELLAWIRG